MIKELLAVGHSALAGLPRRIGPSFVVVFGMMVVSGVFVSLLALADGFQSAFVGSGGESRLVVLSSADAGKAASTVTRDQDRIISDIARQHGAVASSEKYVAVTLSAIPKAPLVALHGVGLDAREVWPEVRLIEGTWFSPGLRQIVVGRTTTLQNPNLRPGAKIDLSGEPWVISGIFEAAGTSLDAEFWAAADMVTSTYSPGGNFNSSTIAVHNPSGAGALKQALSSNPRLNHAVVRERDYNSVQSSKLTMVMRLVGYLIAVIMATGAMFTAINALDSAVSSRTQEMGVLRALGFGRLPVVTSVILESVLLSIAGATLGAAAAYVAINDHAFSMLSSSTGASMLFRVEVTPTRLAQSVLLATIVGLLASALPSIRAARLSILDAVRAR